MKKKLRSFYVIITSVIVSLLHLSFAFAKSSPGSKSIFHRPENIKNIPVDSAQLRPVFKSVYDSLHLNASGLSHQAFEYAKKGFDKLMAQGKIINDSVISIIDFSQPSSRKRLYVLDIKNYKILFQTLVAHGKNSGREWASSFSNQPSSFKSSPGFYITKETYNGNNGYSLKLEGVERGINDNAGERAIVIHGAGYVNESYVTAQGYIGRSEGCPAVPVAKAIPIINKIKNGTCLFIYQPGKFYRLHSPVLN